MGNSSETRVKIEWERVEWSEEKQMKWCHRVKWLIVGEKYQSKCMDQTVKEEILVVNAKT